MKHFYRQFNHTSDLGIEVFGPNLKELYENAATSLFDLLTDLKKVRVRSHRNIVVTGDDEPLVMRELLAELLYIFQVEGFICKTICINIIDVAEIEAEIGGERFNADKHAIRREIKSITYHQLDIKKTETGFQARIVLDI